MKLGVLVCCLAFVSVGVESADAQRRGPARQPALGVHPVGAYGGVQPGVKRAKVYKDRRPVRNRAARKKVLRWVGFQSKGSGSRIFVQLTGDVEYSQRVTGPRLIVSLAGARLGGRNARRALDTRFFDTAVSRAVAKRVRRAVELHITFKNPADAREASASLEKNDTDGFTYLFLDFGAGTAAASDDDDEVVIDEDDEN